MLGVSLLLAMLSITGCDVTASREPAVPVAYQVSLVVARAVWTGKALQLVATPSEPTDLLWDFGDGQELTIPAIASDKPIEHAWDTPGSYTVSVRALHPQRALSKALDGVAIRQVQVLAPGVFKPSQSAFLITRSDVAVALSEDADLMTVARLVGEKWSIERRIKTCKTPRTVTFEPIQAPTKVALSCEGSDRIQILDLTTGQEVASHQFPWGSRPCAVLWRSDGIFTTLRGRGQVAHLKIDGKLISVEQQVNAIVDARGLASLPDGSLLITRWRSAADHGALVHWRPGQDKVTEISLAWADLAPADSESGGVPSYLDQVLVRPQADEAWVPGLHANNRDGAWRNGIPLSHDTSTRAVLSRLKIDSNLPGSVTEISDQRLLFEDRGFIQAGAISKLGDWLFVVDRGARSVERFDLARGGVQAGSILQVGYAPRSVALSDDGNWLLVDAELSRQLVIYRLTDRGPLPQTAEFRLPLVDKEPLSPAVLRGKQLFNDSFDTRLADDSYIACAHCHLEGESDNRVWDFTDRGEGLRNTPSLIGRGGMAHGPLHWSANFDELQDFEDHIRKHFGGFGLMTDAQYAETIDPLGPPKAGQSEDLDALAGYMSSLKTPMKSPFIESQGTLTEAAARGRALFYSPDLACVNCHKGPHLTDSQWLSPAVPLLHDVGTLKPSSGARLGQSLLGIDTPGLSGVWNNAPYLHDGRAESLESLWTEHNPADQHGVTSQLKPSQIADLVSYLRTL